MATELISTPTAATRPAPSTFNKKGNGLKGLEKQRLRAAGKSFDKPEELKEFILNLIIAGPKTPGQILEKIGGSAERVRLYCKDLERDLKIEKEGAYWKKRNATSDEIKARRLESLSEDEFFALPIMEPFVKNSKRPDLIADNPEGHLKKFRNICIGKYVKSFKCHPDDWVFPDTVHAFREAYIVEKGQKRLPSGTRQAIRYFVELCMQHKLSESENAMLGIDGSKDNMGAYADCMMSDEEYNAIIEFLKIEGDQLTANAINYFYAEAQRLKADGDRKKALAIAKRAQYLEKHPTQAFEVMADVSFGLETFFRPETKFNAKPGNFSLIKSVLTRARTEWDQDWTIDQGRIRDLQMFRAMNPQLESKITIETLPLETIEGKGFETKTGVEYPKEIRNPLAVSICKDWIFKHRQAKATMFGQDGETFKQYERRMVPILQYVYKKAGLTHVYFQMRPLYALRHCGAHLWLRRTEYNYNAVASMGWEDINTLRQFYGKYDHRERKKAYVKAW